MRNIIVILIALIVGFALAIGLVLIGLPWWISVPIGWIIGIITTRFLEY